MPARSWVIAARVLALAAAAAGSAGAAVLGAAAAAVVVVTVAEAAGAADVAGAAEEAGAADEIAAAVEAVFCAAGVGLAWCPAQPVASVTTSVTPATSVREDLRITSAP